MRTTILGDPAEVATAGADLVAAAVRDGATTLGLATGSSPQGTYDELSRRVADGRLSLAGCRAFLLDEYVGLPADSPQAYRSVIRHDLVDRVDLDPDRVHGPDGTAPDLDAEAERYEGLVREAGVELQVLGIGRNGHLGFNEPGSPLDSVTRVLTLTDRTREDNARFFDSLAEVPTEVITQGLATIARARHLVLIATGAAKAAAVAAALTGPVTPDCPASVLQRHPEVDVLLDRAAASLLPLTPAAR